ncbi:hypothetical protein ADUPG1_011101 [Aduncisulcus paluster]|uniref:Uncharacterized protein n=1 Tax=Aduncisulcus paluster TaxID=2918883 RepID=A0ABQ5JY66_9EUKA|nr:hypothetical protein ADUPG1_011101 [Aduncisulcus paluster]
MNEFAEACAKSTYSDVYLTYVNSSDNPIIFDSVPTYLICPNAVNSFIVSFVSALDFQTTAVLRDFTFAGDGTSDITFYKDTTFMNLSISNAKIKIAKSDDPLIMRNVSITSSRVRVSYPSLIPYGVYLYEETTLTIVGTLQMLPGTYIEAVSDSSMQNVAIIVNGDIEFSVDSQMGKPGQIVADNIINSDGSPFLTVDGAMCHMTPDAVYTARSIDFSNINVSSWKSPLHFTGSIPPTCDIDVTVQFGLKRAAFTKCKAYRGGALQIDADVGIEHDFYFDYVTFDQCTAIGGGAFYTASPVFVKDFGVDSARPDKTKTLEDYVNDGSVSKYPLILSKCTASTGGGFVLEASASYQKNASLELLPTSRKMKSFLTIPDGATDDDLATKYAALIPFVLNDCTADYGNDYNTNTVHMCYTIDSQTYCPSMSTDFVDSVSSAAWDANVSVNDESSSDDYYASDADTFLSAFETDTGIVLSDYAISYEGGWLADVIAGSDDPDTADAVFEDNTDPLCYSDPFGNAVLCSCSIDPYMDSTDCGVSYSDFDDLDNVTDTGIVLSDYAISYEGGWLADVIAGSDDPDTADAVFEDNTDPLCYSDPFGNAVLCSCSIDPYMDSTDCGVSYSDFDDLDNVVIKEITGNPCEDDAYGSFSEECECYLNPSIDGCAVDTSGWNFYECYSESGDLDSCCESYDYPNPLCCTADSVPDDMADTCTTYNALGSEDKNISGYDTCYTDLSVKVDSVIVNTNGLATCCIIFGLDADQADECTEAFNADDFAALNILNAMTKVDENPDIDTIIETYCGDGTDGNGTATCNSFQSSTEPRSDLYDICIEYMYDSGLCCLTSAVPTITCVDPLDEATCSVSARTYPKASCGAEIVNYSLSNIGDATIAEVETLFDTCQYIDGSVDLSDTVCDLGTITEFNALGNSIDACLELYSVAECCSYSGLSHNISFFESSEQCQKYRYYTKMMEMYDNDAAASLGITDVCNALHDFETTGYLVHDGCLTFDPLDTSVCLVYNFSPVALDAAADSLTYCTTLLTNQPVNKVDCILWANEGYTKLCLDYFNAAEVAASSYSLEDLVLNDAFVKLSPLEKEVILLKRERYERMNASPRPLITPKDASISYVNTGIAIDEYSKSVTVSLYSYFGEPTISLEEDGTFITLATVTTDDVYYKTAVSPVFFQFTSSFSSVSHSQAQDIVISAPQEETYGYAYLKMYGNEVNPYKLALHLPVCSIDAALEVTGSNVFRGMCTTCSGPSTYKGIKESGAVCQICPDGANCHDGGSIGSDSGYWTWLDADTGAIVVRSDGTVIHHECPIDDTCTGNDDLLTENSYVMSTDLIDEECAEGHSGSVCLVCDEGWVRSGPNDNCGECGDTTTVALVFGGILLIQLLFMMYGCIQIAREQLNEGEGDEEPTVGEGAVEMTVSKRLDIHDSNSDIQAPIDVDGPTDPDDVDERLKNAVDVSTALSLLLSHWQLLIVAPWGVSWGVLALDSLDLSPQIFSTGLMCLWPDLFTPWSSTLFNMIFPTFVIISSFFGLPSLLRKVHRVFKKMDVGILFSLFCELFLLISTEAAASVFRVFELGKPNGMDDSISDWVWLYDVDIRLSDNSWKILCILAAVILVFNILIVPIIIAVLAVTRVKRIGRPIPLMDGLKEGFTWFLVSLLIFRQLLQILVEVVDGGNIQIFGIAILLILARLVFWKFAPFDKTDENTAMIWSPIPLMDGLKEGFTWFLVSLLIFRQLLQILVEVVDGGNIQIFGIAILLILARLVFWKFAPFDKTDENTAMIWSFDILALSYLTLGLGNILKDSPGGEWIFYIFVAISIIFNILMLVVMILSMTKYLKLVAAKKLRDVVNAGKERIAGTIKPVVDDIPSDSKMVHVPQSKEHQQSEPKKKWSWGSK